MSILKFLLQIFLIYIILFEVVLSLPNWYMSKKGIKYLIDDELKYTWYMASRECARRDLQLVVIDKEEIQFDLSELLTKELGKSRDFWIGANDAYSENRAPSRLFYWSATGEKLKYYYWVMGQPDNSWGFEHCIHIRRQNEFRWHDSTCSRECGFICTEKLSLKCLELVEEIVENCQVV